MQGIAFQQTENHQHCCDTLAFLLTSRISFQFPFSIQKRHTSLSSGWCTAEGTENRFQIGQPSLIGGCKSFRNKLTTTDSWLWLKEHWDVIRTKALCLGIQIWKLFEGFGPTDLANTNESVAQARLELLISSPSCLFLVPKSDKW